MQGDGTGHFHFLFLITSFGFFGIFPVHKLCLKSFTQKKRKQFKFIYVSIFPNSVPPILNVQFAFLNEHITLINKFYLGLHVQYTVHFGCGL